MDYHDSDDEDQGVNHPDAGTALFEYWHLDDEGTLGRYAFSMRVGDNPDFWKARILMPGAEFHGICDAAFDVDTGAVEPKDEWPEFMCLLRAGSSTFSVGLRAPDIYDARIRCEEIGGLRVLGDDHPTLLGKIRLAACWLWERRPVVRWRSPLDL